MRRRPHKNMARRVAEHGRVGFFACTARYASGRRRLDPARRRLVAAAARIRHQPLELRATLRAALTDSSAFAAERGVRLESQAGGAVPSSGDPERLRQAFTHLILNAIERSPLGAAVSFEVAAHGGGASVLIEDRGAQAFTSRDLGVSLATTIVEQLGGTLSHSPRAGGPGVVLHVVLPRAPRTR